MQLDKRIARLEANTRAALESTISCGSADRLSKRLAEIADIWNGKGLDEAWCKREAPAAIAAMCIRELKTGTHSPALWARAAQLEQRGGTPTKLFSIVLAARNEV